MLAVSAYGIVAFVYSRHLAEYEYRLDAWPAQSAYEPGVAIKTQRPDRVRILAIDGGARLRPVP